MSFSECAEVMLSLPQWFQCFHAFLGLVVYGGFFLLGKFLARLIFRFFERRKEDGTFCDRGSVR